MSPEQTADNSRKKDQTAAVSRRDFLKLASASGVASATSGLAFASSAVGSKSNDGTPEQIHITWGNDPATEVAISWCSPGRSVNPRVKVKAAGEETRTVHADQRIYTDGLNDETVYSYHARVHGLKPGRAYTYEVTAENDRNFNGHSVRAFRPRQEICSRFAGQVSAIWRLRTQSGRSLIRRPALQ